MSLFEMAWRLKTSLIEDEEDFFPEFQTHLGYVNFLAKETNNLKITSDFSLSKKRSTFSKEYKNKIKLIECFKESLDSEYKSILDCKDFAEFNNTWISTKSYYLLFHMWCVVHSLILDEIKLLQSEHRQIKNFVKGKIESKNIIFDKESFNQLYAFSEMEAKKNVSGRNLSSSCSDEENINFILRKIANYKINFFKWHKGIKNFRKKKDQEARDKFMNSEKIALIEFFYMYRIKTDYRDVNFLEKCKDSDAHKEYYENYYKLTCNFFEALKVLINNLSQQRYFENLLKD